MNTVRFLIGLLISTISANTAFAGSPEYMKIELKNGLSIEAKGHLNADGHFVATDIALLDGTRRPKIRGPIGDVNAENNAFVILGQTIRIDEDTEFDTVTRPTLTADQHVEVKSKVEEDGSWVARSIETLNVKPSVKLKMTITDAMVDGESPDTLDCSGFRILLVNATDIELSGTMPTWREYMIFREIAYSSPLVVGHGIPLVNDRFLFTFDYRHNFQSANQYDLTNQFSSDLQDTQPEIRLGLAGYWTPTIRTLAQFRIRQRYIVSFQGSEPPTRLDAHFIQLNLLLRNIWQSGLTFMIGRQRFKEPREWLFDDYLDAARLYYNRGRVELEAAYVEPIYPFNDKFDTWTDVMAAASVYALGGKTTAYTLIRSDSDEIRKREPIYYGLRYFGDPIRSLRLWGDVSILRGEDKGRELDAWAFDVGAIVRLRRVFFQPFASASYAIGSGTPPGDTGIDGRYRQTGYQDNTARLGGVNSVPYYGSVLDPELSNIKIASAGAGVRPHRNLSFEVVYHRYFQHYADEGLRGDLIDPPARPNGIDTDIGWAVDGVVGIRQFWRSVRMSWMIGVFQPGTAFGPRQDRAIYNRVDLRVRI